MPSGREGTRGDAFHGLLGASVGIRRVYRKIELFAPSDLPVVFTGETGTGKTLAARALHQESDTDGRFVDVDCAVPQDDLVRARLFGHTEGAFTGASDERGGLLARADGGVLFLDEIAELSLDAQAMLLKAVEERRYRPVGSDRAVRSEFRVVAATNRDLAGRIEEGAFREDLYHRLSGVRIHLPPLREREGDVGLLAREFLRRRADGEEEAPDELTPEAIEALEEFHWPGNVRQLQQAVKKAAVLARGRPEIDEDTVREALPAGDPGPRPHAGGTLTLEHVLERTERNTIRRALERAGGHREKAAELLGISVSTLYRKLAEHGIDGASDAS